MTSEVLREHPEILFNQTIKKTYKLIKLLGKGTFSVVYQCVNLQNNEKLALKVGFPGEGQKMLNAQKKIYRMICAQYGNGERGVTGFAKYYEFGKTQKFNFMVFERLSVSLQDIFLKLDHKFSIKTVLNIGLQGIQLIEKIHKLGYLHRDIKPANFLLGHGNKKDRLFLIDFGLVRKIIEHQGDRQIYQNEDYSQFNELSGKQFVGTKRFASIASHMGMEQSKKDDLQSLGYTLIFLLKGRLPWQGIKLSSKFQKHQTIGKIKQNINLEEFCKLQIKDILTYSGGNFLLDLDVFLKLFKYLRALHFGDTPNYDVLKKLFIEQINNIDKKPVTSGFNRWKCKGKFDWMDEPEQQNQKNDKDDKRSRQDKYNSEDRQDMDDRQDRYNREQRFDKEDKYDRQIRYEREERDDREDREDRGGRRHRQDRYERQGKRSKQQRSHRSFKDHRQRIRNRQRRADREDHQERYNDQNQRKRHPISKSSHRQRYMK